jgi:hypothetical protein
LGFALGKLNIDCKRKAKRLTSRRLTVIVELLYSTKITNNRRLTALFVTIHGLGGVTGENSGVFG